MNLGKGKDMKKKIGDETLLKDGKQKKLYFGKALRIFATILLTATVACGGYVAKNFNPDTHILPSQQAVATRLLELYGDESEMFLRGSFGDVVRLACPKKGDSIKVNVKFAANDLQKSMMEDVVQELNEVFAVINPNYKFQINYKPSLKDQISPYSINVEEEAIQNPHYLGVNRSKMFNWSTKLDGKEFYKSSVVLDTQKLSKYDERVFRNSFLHEICHSLGFGDAYQNENATDDTIMGSDGLASFSNIDLYTLDAFYRTSDRPLTDEQVYEFIDNYQSSSLHTPAQMTKKINEQVLGELAQAENLKKYLIEKYGDVEDVQKFIKAFSENNGFSCQPQESTHKYFGEILPQNADASTNFHFMELDAIKLEDQDGYKQGTIIDTGTKQKGMSLGQASAYEQPDQMFNTKDGKDNRYTNMMLGGYNLAVQYNPSDGKLVDIILMKETENKNLGYFITMFDQVQSEIEI